MSNLVNLGSLFHRSKDRIKNLGEVFTPESFVEDMLNLLGKKNKSLWSDHENVFFEPCSGHGNIVIPIYKRRLEELYKKAISNGYGLKNSDAAFYAVANSLNTLWAIDIDIKNVENCRTRLFASTLDFLKEKTRHKTNYELLFAHSDSLAHIVATIRWHISVNETLSSLSESKMANGNAALTKLGLKWLERNGHQPLNFDLTWATYFDTFEKNNKTPIEFERAKAFIKSAKAGRLRNHREFDFAAIYLRMDQKSNSKSLGA